MFCKNCGQELQDDAVFCGNCGSQVTKEEQEVVTAQPVENNERENVFARIANIFGNISLWFCWTFFVPLILSEAGIILAVLGMIFKNKFPKNSEIAKGALIKNIIAFVIGMVLFIVIYAILIAAGAIAAGV